ncbi:hypothetical protein [Nannocystis sp. SCPEA4]|uniref:hypothetical protein n=1 Tax=Nannocystis sp. SCPEA4 TaxID=2996787 RepID=UPI0022701646|nr:hypothetical protein [Nannocystis sp. SCPEA4]MCY1058404.1 hypothetical protein [Nannocystis sp. SCPEA4]
MIRKLRTEQVGPGGGVMVAAALVSTLALGCNAETTFGSAGEDEPCVTCPETAQACACKIYTPGQPYVAYACNQQQIDDLKEECRVDLININNKDEMEPVFDMEFECKPALCTDEEGETTEDPTETVPTTGEPSECIAWNPSAIVDYVSGVHYMDAGDIRDVVSDPLPLVLCDDAQFMPLTGTLGFEITQADAGELLYELGLRDGDIPLEINGFPLDTPEEAMLAFHELWYIEMETDFELEVLRGVSNATLYYTLDFTE